MRHPSLPRTLSVCATIIAAAAIVSSAGDLNPPGGPVAPTGKTLTEAEPRIAVNATNTPGDASSVFRITQPGSYYLTGNLNGAAGKHGIQIAADGVTLDLSGFALIGAPGSLDGINMPSFQENVVIRNGHVRTWGESGMETRIDFGRIEGVTAVRNGAWGIDNASSGTFTSHITSCSASANGALVAGTGGIRGGQASVIVHCISYSNAGAGIAATSSSIVRESVSRANAGAGITATTWTLITDCTAAANTGNGITVGNDCKVIGNTCGSNGTAGGDGAGIHATGTDNRIEANLCTDADRGIDIDGAGNFIARNICSGNVINWDVAEGNVILVIEATAAGAVSGNTGGAAPGSTDPNANFTY